MINFDRPGRMISGGKVAPKGHICVWNANVCSKSRGKIWFGDIDLTTDTEDLKKLAVTEGEAIYILREMDGRFMNERSPLFDKAVVIVLPSGLVTIHSQ